MTCSVRGRGCRRSTIWSVCAILALLHEIVARCTTIVRGRVQEWQWGRLARRLLWHNGVMPTTPTETKEPEAPRVPFVDRVVLADKLIEKLEAEGLIDPSEVADVRERPMAASFTSGEQRLAFEMLMTAIYDAAKPAVHGKSARRGRGAHRNSARAWLMDNSALFSARTCAESFGINYDAMRSALRKRWATEVAEEGVVVEKRRHTQSGSRLSVRGRVYHEGSRK